MAQATATVDHDKIRDWVESRNGHPARVKSTGGGNDPGILRIDYPGYSGGDTLEHIGWDEWFDAFDANNLAFLFQPGGRSRFSKLVDRGSVETGRTAKKRTSAARRKPTAKKSASRKAAAKKSSSKKSSAKKSAAKKSSAKRSTSKKSSAKRSAGKKSSAKRSSAKRSSAKRSTAAKSASKRSSSAAKKARSKSTSRGTTGRTGRSANTTTDHDTIRRWVEARGGWPATVKSTKGRGEDAGLLRIDYPGYSGQGTLERIDWNDFFEKFDEQNLAFLFQDKKNSRFSKFVRR
jgi:histone H1-like nucleoprotein HC2